MLSISIYARVRGIQNSNVREGPERERGREFRVMSVLPPALGNYLNFTKHVQHIYRCMCDIFKIICGSTNFSCNFVERTSNLGDFYIVSGKARQDLYNLGRKEAR